MQGDNAAMAMYALSTPPQIQALSNETANDEVKQVSVWYADDSLQSDHWQLSKKMVGIPTGQWTRLWVVP